MNEAVIPIVTGIGAVIGILGMFQHSHTWISYGKTLNRIFYSPCMHLIHHSRRLEHRDKNLGIVGGLSLWDRLFGTLYVPDSQEETPFGSADEELGINNPHRTVGRYYAEPVVTCARLLAQTVRTATQRHRVLNRPDIVADPTRISGPKRR